MDDTEKYSKKITSWNVNFEKVKEKHSIYKKNQFVLVENEEKKKWVEEEIKKEERSG